MSMTLHGYHKAMIDYSYLFSFKDLCDMWEICTKDQLLKYTVSEQSREEETLNMKLIPPTAQVVSVQIDFEKKCQQGQS